MEQQLIVLYRISDSGYKKEKLPHATKSHCLENALNVFGKAGFYIFADHCGQNTLDMIRSFGMEPRQTSIGSSGQSWKFVQKFAFDNFKKEDGIYFLEDDYLHLDDAKKIMLEGLSIADYVTLYDHKDKYLDGDKGGNPYVKNGGEMSRVLVSGSTHWKTTNSTTMTFGVKLETLIQDFKIWDKYTKGTYPHDFDIFKTLIGFGSIRNKILGKGRRLISPLPGRATHAEINWLSPLVEWEKI
jgi:hypothetical protein